MGNDSIDKVLESRKPIVAMPSPDGPEHNFYSVLGADGLNENYLELKMRDSFARRAMMHEHPSSRRPSPRVARHVIVD